jgi:hypothetical protein
MGGKGRSNSKAQATNDDDAQCGFNKTRTARVKTIRRCTAAIVAAHWLRYTRVRRVGLEQLACSLSMPASDVVRRLS